MEPSNIRPSMAADMVKQYLAKPIQLADQVTKLADEAHSSKQECAELKFKTEKLAGLLRQAARVSSDLYERPTRRIVDDTEQVLEKAVALVARCGANGLVKRVFTIIPNAAFKKISAQLENSIGDVSWLLRVSASADDRDDEYLGLPPIAANEPILGLIWEQIATLHTGSIDVRSEAAASLISLVRDNERNGKLIIEEGGVVPLLKLLKEGHPDGQENAARALGLLARDPESVEHLLHAGVCNVFEKILKESSMKVQSIVAWAVSEFVQNHIICQDHFAQNNIIRLLVGHLAFGTVQEHSKYDVSSNKTISIHSVLIANNSDDDNEHLNSKIKRLHDGNQNQKRMHSIVESTMAQAQSQSPNSRNDHNKHKTQSAMSVSVHGIKGKENEDSATKDSMKAMAAKALGNLAKGNSSICRSITESQALLCFAVLLEKGPREVQFYSAKALVEIATVAEQDGDLRRSAFKPNSPAAKAVVDQLLKIIDKADSDLLIPCIKAIGCLARTFRATESRIISPLVRLLDDHEEEVLHEASIALTKFACTENYLHLDHCKAIVQAGGAKHLIQLVYFSEPRVQISSLILLCYIAMHVPDSEALAEAEVLPALELASRQGKLQDTTVNSLLPEAKSRLELYQSRVSKGLFH